MTLHEVNGSVGRAGLSKGKWHVAWHTVWVVSHSALLCLTSLGIPKGQADPFGDVFGNLLQAPGAGWDPAEGAPATAWPPSEGGRAFWACGEQAP